MGEPIFLGKLDVLLLARGVVRRKLFWNAEVAKGAHAEFAESSLRTLRSPLRTLRFKKTIPRQHVSARRICRTPCDFAPSTPVAWLA